MFRLPSGWSNLRRLSLVLVLASQFGCQRRRSLHAERALPAVRRVVSAHFALRAEWFQSGGELPRVYTCDGPDASPGLTWTKPPAGTRTIALIMEDAGPTAGSRVHWLIYDIPAAVDRLLEARPQRYELLDGSRQGINDFGGVGYCGACPPPGKIEHYIFKLYALDSELELAPRLAKEGLAQAMEGHVLAQAEITGFYMRKSPESPE